MSIIKLKCEYPAPLVVNGGSYIGCQKDAGHEGQHEIRIEWGSNEYAKEVTP